jgi:hypothetical protein
MNNTASVTKLPPWWSRVVSLVRGLSLGFLLGYLFAGWAPPSTTSPISLTVIAATLLLAALLALPKAWVEQRSRLRAARAGTDVEQNRP